MKKPSKKQMKVVGVVVAVVALVVTGVVGTLSYQNFIENTRQAGVREYQAEKCQKYSNEDKSAFWLECDVVRVDNGR